MEKFAVSRLIGAPPGYVGYDEGGQLTEAVRRKPYSVVLLDEIEKAHPDVFNVLLQVLDDGRLTDSKGRTVDFKNTIIIMTSNLGSHLISEKIAADFSKNGSRWEAAFEELKEDLLRLLRQSIRPEFLNRVDEVIIFRPLGASDIREVVDLQLRRVEEMIQKRGIRCEFSDAAKDWLGEAGYDPMFGARPLKRVIQKRIVNPLSRRILAGEFGEGDCVAIDLDPADTLEFTRKIQVAVEA